MATLSPKHQRFVDEYLIDLNATQAAIRAGYSAKTAKEQASRVLTNVNVKRAIDEAIAARSKRTGFNHDRILNEYAKLAFVNPIDVIDMDEATIKGEANREDTACIQSIKVKKIPTEDGYITEREIKVYDKTKALDQLGRHLGMFKDNININANIGVKFVDDINGSS